MFDAGRGEFHDMYKNNRIVRFELWNKYFYTVNVGTFLSTHLNSTKYINR